MGAGKYRHYITFQHEVTTGTDDYGHPIVEWQAYKSMYAEIKPIKGTEYWQSQQVNAEVTHRVTTRYTDGITSEMRIKFGSRYFEIEPPLNLDERNKELVMLCKEKNL